MPVVALPRRCVAEVVGAVAQRTALGRSSGSRFGTRSRCSMVRTVIDLSWIGRDRSRVSGAKSRRELTIAVPVRLVRFDSLEIVPPPAGEETGRERRPVEPFRYWRSGYLWNRECRQVSIRAPTVILPAAGGNRRLLQLRAVLTDEIHPSLVGRPRGRGRGRRAEEARRPPLPLVRPLLARRQRRFFEARRPRPK